MAIPDTREFDGIRIVTVIRRAHPVAVATWRQSRSRIPFACVVLWGFLFLLLERERGAGLIKYLYNIF